MNFNLDNFFNYSLDMLCIAGLDGFFKLVNPAFTMELGWSQEELLTKPILEFVHKDDVDETINEIRNLKAGIPSVSFENRFNIKIGGYKNLNWTAFPEPESGLYYGVARDTTSKKIEENKREQLLKKLNNQHSEIEQLNDELITVCSWTKKIKDKGQWISFEDFLEKHFNIKFTHGISEEAYSKFMVDFKNKYKNYKQEK